MSTATYLSLTVIGQKLTIYADLMIVATGMFGNIFNLIVFLSLRTFRQSTCAFYLTVMSFVNIGQLFFGVFSRVMIYGFAIDWTATSLLYCKVRLLALLTCSILSNTCLCLATIDQYLVTCTCARWQRWSTIKVARRLLLLCFVMIMILLSPYPIFLNQVTAVSGKTTCVITNDMASRYASYFIGLFPTGIIPDSITFTFGLLAYRNVQQIAYRTVPLVRRELDKQLTIMVLVQVVINLITNIPCVTMIAVLYGTSGITDAVIVEKIQFTYTVTFVLYYSYFASSFYIYMCVSERFRRQWKYVLCDFLMNRWRHPLLANNQVVPVRVTNY